MDGEPELSKEAQQIFLDLGPEERKLISRDSPYRRDRGRLLRRLFRRGVKQIVLTEVSGMSRSEISRICSGKAWAEQPKRRGGDSKSA
jgi:hypothetical protein